MLKPILALALVLATPAVGQSYQRSDIVRGLCQPNGCDEFTVLSAAPVATSPDGTLLRTRVQTFHASSSGRKDRGEQDGYVYCSRSRPALLAERDGRTMAFYLAPFATAESRETIRKNANFHALYFSLCHGAEAGRASVHNLSGVAQSLGYRVALAQSKLEPLARAENVLGPQMSAAARLPQGMEQRLERLAPPRAIPPADRRAVGGYPAPPQAPAVAGPESTGIMAGPRRLTNRAFDVLDEFGSWVFGR